MKILYPKERLERLLDLGIDDQIRIGVPRNPSIQHLIKKRGCAGGVGGYHNEYVFSSDNWVDWECNHSYQWRCDDCPAFKGPRNNKSFDFKSLLNSGEENG